MASCGVVVGTGLRRSVCLSRAGAIRAAATRNGPESGPTSAGAKSPVARSHILANQMAGSTEETSALDETLHAFYRTGNAERAILALSQCLDGGDIDNPAVLYTFARIAMISPEARHGFLDLRSRDPAYVNLLLRGPADLDFPACSATEIGPGDLDLLWAEFFVTGDPGPVRRIVGVLDGSDRVREFLGSWLRDQGQTFFGRRAIARFRPMLVRCQFPIEYESHSIDEGVDLDVHVALNAQGGRLKFDELPFKLSVDELVRLAVKSAAVWSLVSLARDHERVAESCASEATQPGGAARRLLQPRTGVI